MDKEAVLEKFHTDRRVNFAPEPGYEVIKGNHTLRLVSTHEGTPFNMVLCSELNDANADAVIEEEIAYFQAKNQPFEWKLYDYDKPDDLSERLTAHGLKMEEEETLLVAQTAGKSTTSLPKEVEIKKILSASDLQTLLTAVGDTETHPEHIEAIIENLSIHLKEAPDTIGIFGAYWDGKPVSMGWAFYSPNSDFCGLFGGMTLEKYRGKGLYKALVNARAKEANEKGLSFLYVDAGPMSQPILKKLGFVELSKMQGFHWKSY